MVELVEKVSIPSKVHHVWGHVVSSCCYFCEFVLCPKFINELTFLCLRLACYRAGYNGGRINSIEDASCLGYNSKFMLFFL